MKRTVHILTLSLVMSSALVAAPMEKKMAAAVTAPTNQGYWDKFAEFAVQQYKAENRKTSLSDAAILAEIKGGLSRYLVTLQRVNAGQPAHTEKSWHAFADTMINHYKGQAGKKASRSVLLQEIVDGLGANQVEAPVKAKVATKKARA